MVLTAAQEMAYEVEWYREHGRYPDRIQVWRKGFHVGREYVVCDFIWNYQHPLAKETIRPQLCDYIQERLTGIIL